MATRRLGFFALGLDAVVMLLTAGSLPAFAAAWHVPQDVAGLVFTANGLGFVAAVLAAGLLADRHGKRAVGAASAAALGLGVILFSQSGTLAAGLLAAAVVGAGAGSVESLVTALLPDLYPGREGYANNFAQVFFSIGATAGPLLLLPGGLPWRTRLLLCGLAWLVVAAGLWRERGQDRPTAHGGTVGAGWAAPLEVLRAPGVWSTVAAMALYTGVEVAAWGWLFAVVTRPGGFGPAWAVAELSGFWLAMGVGRWLSSHLAERVDLARLIGVQAAAGIPTLLLALLLRRRLAALLAVLACGLALSGLWPSIVALGQRRHGRSAALASLLVGAGAAGSLLVPVAFGVVSARMGLPVAAAGLALLLAPVAPLCRAGDADLGVRGVPEPRRAR